MSAPAQAGGEPIVAKRQLVEFLEAGCKPREAWRIGTEHEKFAFRLSDLSPLAYDAGIKNLLEGLTAFGWTPVLENGAVIALSEPGGAAITLEPGGQLELSGAPLETLHQTCCEAYRHLEQVKRLGDRMGVGFLGVGFHPKARREDFAWMPKDRYRIMRAYMPVKGGQGLDMMLRTCTVQANLDYASESDMVRKLRASLALQPVVTALFASSPFVEGKPTGLLSNRAQAWTDTDSDRTGLLPFAFEPGMGFERYVDWMLDVPMYFVFRDGRYIDAAGQSFKDFMAGKLAALPGERPTINDWADHLTTAFPEVRLKRFLEMRGADGGPWNRVCALPALWTGLLYDDASLDAALDLGKGWTPSQRERLRQDVIRLGLKAEIGGRTVQDLAKTLLGLADAGLARRNRLNDAGEDETFHLDSLRRIADSGRTPAEEMLDAFHGRWQGSVDPLFAEYCY